MAAAVDPQSIPKKKYANVRKSIDVCSESRDPKPITGSPAVLVYAMLLGSALVVGCPSTPEDRRDVITQDEGQELFGGAAGGSDRDDAWTIVLAAFRGDVAAQAAQFALARVVEESGLSDVRIDRRGEAVLLTSGRFDGPTDPRATAALERIQNTELRGGRPFQQALLTPPEPAGGKVPQYDLSQVEAFYGPGYVYTLQVGAYGRDDGRRPSDSDREEARKAAEEAVAVLRAEGEMAFYYHGPNMSSVTVGLFREDEINVQTGVRSPAFYDLQAKFPFNLLNGAQRTVRVGGSRAQPQRSALVAIP